tara:strand:+ start:3194 stop:4195 length:1002 start_codon:yes stop_codon:yes gene_type:complete
MKPMAKKQVKWNEDTVYLAGVLAASTCPLQEDGSLLISRLPRSLVFALRARTEGSEAEDTSLRLRDVDLVSFLRKELDLNKTDSMAKVPTSLEGYEGTFFCGVLDALGPVGAGSSYFSIPPCPNLSVMEGLLKYAAQYGLYLSHISLSQTDNNRLEGSYLNILDFSHSLGFSKSYQMKAVFSALAGHYADPSSAYFKYWICRGGAPPPSKSRPSDSGYDLSLVEEISSKGGVTFYGTGVKVQPPDGHYFDLVPRSSLQKSGYLLANNVGVIDHGYRGELIVGLYKFNKRASKLELPFRAVQIIPRKISHFIPVEGEDLDSTVRGDGGFGSTGQ